VPLLSPEDEYVTVSIPDPVVCVGASEVVIFVRVTDVADIVDVEDAVEGTTEDLLVSVELAFAPSGEFIMNKPATTTTQTTVRASNAVSTREMPERVT
jgi:hypothetical protein